MPAPLDQRGGARVGEPHAQFDARLKLDDIELADVGGRSDDAFGKAEAERKIVEILRRRHHDRIGAAVIAESDGGLFRHQAFAVSRAGASPDCAVDRAAGVRMRYSAASTVAAMRRLLRASSSYFSCHSVGPFEGVTCTAVTLYSGTIGGPVRIVGGDDVGLRGRMMERRVDHARRHALGDQRAQRGLAGAARELHPIAVADAALFGIVRMDFQPVLLVPEHVGGAARLCADIILAEDAAGGEQQREARAGLFVGRECIR